MAIDLLKISDSCGWHIETGTQKREWLNNHAYKCGPILDANKSCLNMVLDEDIVCEWNGGPNQNDAKVLQGPADAKFGVGTITLHQSWIWKTTIDKAILLGPPPNHDEVDWRMMDAWVDSHKLNYPWFPTIRLLKPGKHTIPKGSVIGAIREVSPHSAPPYFLEKKADEITSQRHKRLGANRTSGRGAPGFVWRKQARRHANLERTGVWLDVLQGDKWLERDECENLIKGFTDTNTQWRENVEVWWPDKTKYSYLAEAFDDIGLAIESVTGIPVQIDNPHVVRWKPGSFMPLHIDIDGGYEQRQWGSLIYLNTTKSGGLTIVPSREIESTPFMGRMMAWPAGTTPHSVTEVEQDRYTAICWWGAKPVKVK
ncbi:MAG: DUF6065 family protein [Rhodobacteraceae bacterium]|nr:DUF6065 family protein [Paracoccaceae bacterium]